MIEKNEAKVFCGGLSPDTTEDKLKAHFEQFGPVKNYVIMKLPTGQSRCFGFVTFQVLATAQDVVLRKFHSLDGKAVECKLAVPGQKQLGGDIPDGTPIKAKKIFVGGLHGDASTEVMREYFSQFGEIEDVISMNDNPNHKRGFGYVTFKYQDAVERVVRNPTAHELCGKTVECKRCVPRESEKGKAKGKGKYFAEYDSSWKDFYQDTSKDAGYGVWGAGGGYGAQAAAATNQRAQAAQQQVATEQFGAFATTDLGVVSYGAYGAQPHAVPGAQQGGYGGYGGGYGASGQYGQGPY
jgi:RNA recognition motif-containing protein